VRPALDRRSLIDALDLAVDRRIVAVGLPLQRSHPDGLQSSPELTTDSPVYQELVKIGPMLPTRMTSEMNSHAKTPMIVRPAFREPKIEALFRQVLVYTDTKNKNKK